MPTLCDTGRLFRMNLPNGLQMSDFQLKNGIRVFVVNNPSSPTFVYQSWFNVGSTHEKLDPSLNCTGLAHLFEHMMFRGTKNYPGETFDQTLTSAGANEINATTWFDRTHYYECLPTAAFEKVVELEADRLINLDLNAALLKAEKGAVLGEYHMGLDDPESIAIDRLYETAFTEHPYRYTTIGTETEIQSFTLKQARYFYETYYHPENLTLLIVGDIQPQDALTLISKHYNQISKKAKKGSRVVSPIEPVQAGQRVFKFQHGQLLERIIYLGFHAVSATHEDYAALLVLSAMMTSGKMSLLHQAWVDSGLAGRVDGNLDQFADPGLMVFSADLLEGKDNSSDLIEAFESSIDFGSMPEKFFQEHVERAKSQLYLEIYDDWEDNLSLASFMGEQIPISGNPADAFKIVQDIQRVDPIHVKEVTSRYLKRSNRTIVYGEPS